MPKNSCIMQIWAESGKSALPICNYSQILYQFLTFTQNLKRSLADVSKQLSENSNVQIAAMREAEKGIDQISEVVQSNSAASEECSATSEELSAQAEAMNELISQFTLRD